MSTTDQFLIALQAYQEIQAENHQPEQSAVFVAPDPLQFDPLPPGSLLLGLGEDNQPLALDLFDPGTGPLLIAADSGSGKTAFIRSLALAADGQEDLQFGVLTPFPEEWLVQETLPACLGIWPAYHPSAGAFLERLVSWAEVLSQTRQAVLLFVDGLEAINLDSQARYHLRWLLANGPQAHIWPIVTINPNHLSRLGSLLDYFTTRLLGHVRRPQVACRLSNDPAVNLAEITPGVQFYLSSPQVCLRFWVSPLEGVSDECRNALV